MKKWHRVLAGALAAIMICLSGVGGLTVRAQTSHTQAEAVAWAAAQMGKTLDYDGVYGGQCVDLIYYYYQYLGQSPVGGNASAYVSNALPSGWQRISYYKGITFQPGDIAVWNPSGTGNGGLGHVGIIESADSTGFNSFEQNYNNVQAVTKHWHYNYVLSCVIRPDFSSAAQVTTSWTSSSSSITETNAYLTARINASTNVQFTRAGVDVWNEQGTLVGQANEATTVNWNYMDIFYDVNSELHITLEPGTTYTYQFWAEFGGNRYYCPKNTFTTGGTKTYNPEGYLDAVTAGEGTVTVRGWAFDRNDLTAQLKIHVYVGGPAGTGKCYEIAADKERTDVEKVYSGVGNYHGFDSTINVNLTGSQAVYVYALNVGKGTNICLGNSTVTIKEKLPESLPFTDVSESDWFYDKVQYVYENSLMSGTDTTHFAPNEPLTRAMFATILYRIGGTPEVTYSAKFSDVPEGQWYTKGIIWANSIGVVSGYSDGRFGTDDSITREQMAAMLYKYAVAKSYDTTASAELSNYSDASQVSSYAVKALKWAVGNGIMSGKTSTTLDPQGKATRAECATIIKSFAEKYL